MNIKILEQRGNEYLIHAEEKKYIFDELVTAISESEALAVCEKRINMLISLTENPIIITKNHIEFFELTPLQMKETLSKIPITDKTDWNEIKELASTAMIEIANLIEEIPC